jgi:hypothetical protein
VHTICGDRQEATGGVVAVDAVLVFGQSQPGDSEFGRNGGFEHWRIRLARFHEVVYREQMLKGFSGVTEPEPSLGEFTENLHGPMRRNGHGAEPFFPIGDRLTSECKPLVSIPFTNATQCVEHAVVTVCWQRDGLGRFRLRNACGFLVRCWQKGCRKPRS